MSIHHRLEAAELSDTSEYALYSVLGDRDTPELFAGEFQLDTKHDVPTGGGNTLDRKTVCIDRTLYAQIMDNEFKATGLTPGEIIFAWCQHEHTELAIYQGDNAVDSYMAAHRRALFREHEFYRARGKNPAAIEAVFWPALVACYDRKVRKPHPEMWCAPLRDNATPHDLDLLEQLQKLGVRDAAKRGKGYVNYGFGGHECGRCINYGKGSPLAACALVEGMVREDRSCDLWQGSPVAEMAKLDAESKWQHEFVAYGPARGEQACKSCFYSDHKLPPRCALVADIRPTFWCRLWRKK